jgi:geranylgeranyl diphosphate synthase, type I
LAALGGGGEEDLRDGILTLPAALAIRDPATAKIFCDPEGGNLAELSRQLVATLPEAEAYLDKIAEEARTEANYFANNSAPLIALIGQTRQLSRY